MASLDLAELLRESIGKVPSSKTKLDLLKEELAFLDDPEKIEQRKLELEELILKEI